ncbi:hypothetical protein H5410_002169 [Solanum commersonii]|uniref:Uncharacterized protein n=1 Tax=Solanum commersonii TaxID=4109 RepID=A0A9J6B1B0_SOLCO|nr:hypothetical protein H5410_002169 [Solanum commersonii]
MEFEEVARNEEIFWTMATTYKRLNTIDSLMINGELSSDPVAIEGSIMDFYQDLYKESKNWRPYLNLYELQGISIEERNNLERVF